jgi:hypothetical protein
MMTSTVSWSVRRAYRPSEAMRRRRRLRAVMLTSTRADVRSCSSWRRVVQ